MGKYLDSVGLSHFMSLIKQALNGKSDTSHTHAASDITSGTLAAARGGTGESTLKDSANALINSLVEGTLDVSNDDTFVITQNADATTQTYNRRKVSHLWAYIKAKADALYSVIGHAHSGLYFGSNTDTSLHRMYISENNNLVIQKRDTVSDSWTSVGYTAVNSSIPTSSSQQAANKVLATPNGSTGYPSMRALVAADLPTVPATKGGTGETSLGDSMDALVDALSTSATIPSDNDYFIEQYYTTPSSGTRCSRRPMTALWNYVKSKIDSVYGLGTVVEDTDTGVSAASATATNLSQVTLSAGTWVLFASASFASNATGRRNIRLSTSSSTTSASAEYSVITPAAEGAATVLTKTIVLVLTTQQTWYLNVIQNSGSTLSCNGIMRAVRIV